MKKMLPGSSHKLACMTAIFKLSLLSAQNIRQSLSITKFADTFTQSKKGQVFPSRGQRYTCYLPAGRSV